MFTRNYLTQINPVHPFPVISIKNILKLSSHAQVFQGASCLQAFQHPHACYISCLYHAPWFDYLNNIWWIVLIEKLLITQFSPASCLSGPNILSTLIRNTLDLCSSLKLYRSCIFYYVQSCWTYITITLDLNPGWQPCRSEVLHSYSCVIHVNVRGLHKATANIIV